MLASSEVVFPSVTATPLSPAKDYGDILQHDWDQAGSDEGNTGSSTGPGPEIANVLWSVRVGGGMISVFDGMAFAASGTTVTALNAFTGAEVWVSEAPGTPSVSGGNAVFKIDDTYFLTQGSRGITVRRISNGELVASLETPNANRLPGSGTYFGGHYSNSMKMYFNHAYDNVIHQAQMVAHDISDPTNPTVAWVYPVDSAAELLCSGDGMVFWGTTEGEVVAVNAQGQKVWQEATLGGIIQQSAMYYNHRLYTSAVSWQITCFEGATGEKVWQAEKGIRAFSAYRGAAGDGMIFESTVELDPYGTIGAWDAETGERLWKQPGYFNINYATYAYADGKVYGLKCDRTGSTGGLVFPGPSLSCWDAKTGTELWNLPGIQISTPSIAYGNLYGRAGQTVYCIGGEPADWSHGLLGNVDQPRVAVGQQGPKDISTPKWYFQTGGDVYSSPAVADGKVYVGSADHHLYCLDAYTGVQLWNFSIGHYLRSSPTVVNGKVYIGADDGNFYCLNAATGAELWSRPAGGFFPYILDVNEGDARSSPLVVGGSMYGGALDGNLYSLNAETGTIQWTYLTGGPIFGSPYLSAGTIYIASGDGYLYAVSTSGALVWKSAFTLNLDVIPPEYCEWYNIGTPNVQNGVLYIGGGVQYGNADPALGNTAERNAYYAAQGQSTPAGANGGGIRMFAFNATTGESIWNQSRAGNTQPAYVPAYVDDTIYAPEFFEITSMDAANPNSTGNVDPVPDFNYNNRRNGHRIWYTWLGYQIQGSVAYADDLTGDKIYAGSDIGSIYCLNATAPLQYENGTDIINPQAQTYSVFTAGGNIAGSPTVWNGRMYVGTTEGRLYCFDDTPVVNMNLYATSSKGAEMWNNETITIGGQLNAVPVMMQWDYDVHAYLPVPSEYSPAMRDVTVQISLTRPDGSNVQLSATTDNDGKFAIDYAPTAVGLWGWVAYYEGQRTVGLTYGESFSEFNYVNVVSPGVNPAPTSTPQPTVVPTGSAQPTVAPTGSAEPTTQPTEPSTASPAPTTAAPTTQPTSTPTEGGLAIEYIYAIIAAVVIIIIVVGAYIYTKRSK